MKKQVIIVGGGASGMAAAISASRMGAQVTILEHRDRVGKKLLSTGNGRCNLSNLFLTEDCYRSSQKEFPMKVLGRFGLQDTLMFFESIGLVTKSKNGYLYPNSEQASSVLDLLRLELTKQNICVVTNCRIAKISRKSGQGFVVKTDQGNFEGHALILAAGSKAAPQTGSDGSGYQMAKEFGHLVISPLPALVQLRCQEKYFKQLAGVRCEAKITLFSSGKKLAEDQGEVQLTDYGLSGIPTFQVSRFAAVELSKKKEVKAVLDFWPSKSREETKEFLIQRAKKMGHLLCGDFLTGILHKKLAAVLMKLSDIPAEQKASQVKQHAWMELLHHIKAFETTVTGTNSYEQAQVCCGGVDTREICPETMESRLVPGLYFAGELLDVDGICGGYNLQWAWSTGCLAGNSAGGDKR